MEGSIKDELHSGVGTYMAKVYGLMVLGVLNCAGMALVIGSNADMVQTFLGTWLVWPLLMAPFGIIIYMQKLREGNEVVLQFLGFLALTAILGIWLSAIMLKFLSNTGYVNIIVNTFEATCGMFGGLCVAGFFSRRDLSATGTFLIAALFGLLTLGVLNYITPMGQVGHYIYSAVGILVFSGLTAYDVQRIKQEYLVEGNSNSNAISGALELLHIIGIGDDD